MTWHLLVRLPKRIRELGGGWQAALSNRDVWRSTRAVRYACDASHTVQDGVLDTPTVFTMSCDAGGAFSTSHTCHPVTCALPALAHTEHPHGEVLYGETVECVDGKRQITPCCLWDGRPKRIPLESASLPPAGGPFFTTDAFV